MADLDQVLDKTMAAVEEALGSKPELLCHSVVTKVDEWKELLNTEPAPLPANTVFAKNMFYKGKKGELVLCFALADTPTPTKAIGAAVGVNGSNMRFASPEVLEQTLGVVQGAVTPLAVINDTSKEVKIVLDKAVVDVTEPLVAVHPCRNDRTVLLSGPQIKTFLEKQGYTAVVTDFAAAAAAEPPAPAAAAAAPAKEAVKKQSVKGETKLGIAMDKNEQFSEWYSEVITKGELLDYYEVSGCYILRPWAFAIWEEITKFFDSEIKKLGVENCYFPMFVTKNALEKEKAHVEGFSAEVAWVGKAGTDDGSLSTNPIAIRPTSETVMYPSYAKWIRSHRDLPLKLNQWCNVVRWEFSHPTPFIRTREFLWQEGHSAFATRAEAMDEVTTILNLYRRTYEELLAVPVVMGTKTEKEKFAGGDYTTSIEAFVPTVGRGCQAATSHHLGQHFAEMFEIEFEDPTKTDGSKLRPHQNSWGMTTRTLGLMVMQHGDNKGLVLPPAVAQKQVVIVPVGITAQTTAEAKKTVHDTCLMLEATFNRSGKVRAKSDIRDNYSPGWKFNNWEMKGVPLRLEIGPKELENKQLRGVRRFDGSAVTFKWDSTSASEGENDISVSVAAELAEIQKGMFERAKAAVDAQTKMVTEWETFTPALNEKCRILAPWCGSEACEDATKKKSAEESKVLLNDGKDEDEKAPSMGAKSLNIPFDQPTDCKTEKCIHCRGPAKQWVLWGRSY